MIWPMDDWLSIVEIKNIEWEVLENFMVDNRSSLANEDLSSKWITILLKSHLISFIGTKFKWTIIEFLYHLD